MPQAQAVLIVEILDSIGEPKGNAVCYRKDQSYEKANVIVAEILGEHHPGCTATYAVLADASQLAGKDIDSDVDIVNGEVVFR